MRSVCEVCKNNTRPVMRTGFPIGLVALVLWFTIRDIDALECYTCTNATNIAECKSSAPCNAGEICFSDHNFTSNGTLYSFGCRLETECKTVINDGNTIGAGSLVGRTGVTALNAARNNGVTGNCVKTHVSLFITPHFRWPFLSFLPQLEEQATRSVVYSCRKTTANESNNSEKECADSTEIHCPTVGAMIDMCSDTEKANTVCRRFCGLCNYVNGQWGTWLAWSRCGVSCGTGTKTRIRRCSEPAPSGGGHVCRGPAQDTDTCTKEVCPVHGSWATWAHWGSCSATCGIGLRRRDRSCSNPYPTLFGDRCFGDARDDDLCLSSACADGGWADWSVWNTCSRACGDGIKTRSRTCDNPLPSIKGNYCQGDPYQVITCNLKSCPETNGGWGTWTVWSHCSTTCDTGLRSRDRDCDTPAPSADGKYCAGRQFDVQQCMVKTCPRIKTSFLVNSATRGSDGILRFSSVLLNEGAYYDTTTGAFTCHYPGLYAFTANVIESGSGNNKIVCYIRRNDYNLNEMYSLQGKIDGKYAVDGGGSATGAATVRLVKGDLVYVYCDSNTGTTLYHSSFTGFLVSSDP